MAGIAALVLADVMSGLQHAGATGFLDVAFDDPDLNTRLASYNFV